MREVQRTQLGELVRTARRRMGWSMRELERRSGISHSTLGEIETGRNANPAPDRVARLSTVLHIPVQDIERAMGIDLGSRLLPWHAAMQIQERLSDAETARIRRYQERIVAERGTHAEAA